MTIRVCEAMNAPVGRLSDRTVCEANGGVLPRQVLIDADGCPVVDLTLQIAKRFVVPVIILCDACASLLLANGVPMKQIQEWLGYGNVSA